VSRILNLTLSSLIGYLTFWIYGAQYPIDTTYRDLSKHGVA